MFSDFDRQAMTHALTLAGRGLETTHPNPRVGCVITKNDRIVAEGWHERAGGPHAEVAALRAAAESVAGATLYVTLEPCSHHGRTPPCIDALIEAGVGRVVFAVKDPNPLVSGQGEQALRNAGIEVESGLLESEAVEMNVGFVNRMRKGLPWTRIKLAMSLDGRTALSSGASRWITGQESRADVQRWRARSSAVMTGVGTVLADDPRLNVRLGGADRRQPLKVILDSRLRTPPEARIFSGDTGGEVLILVAPGTSASARAALEARGARIEELPEQQGMLDLRAVLHRLAELEVNEVLVEAGATLAGQLLERSLADELVVYIAPKLLGPQGRALVTLPELQSLQEAPAFVLLESAKFGDDLRLRLRPR